VVPTILVRKHGILVNILHIRALIKHDTVFLFDSYGSTDSSLHSLFLYNLGHNLRIGAKASGGLAYEFRALEAMLSSVAQALESEMSNLRTLTVELLDGLESEIDREKLKLMLQYSRKNSACLKRASLVQACIDEVLEQDEDLADMYLTQKFEFEHDRASDDHEEIEMLLESFSKQVEGIVNDVENLVANVKSTEEIVELILDSNRNSLLALDLKISIGTMGLGAGALIASAFGMNLDSGLSDHPTAFWIACGTLAMISLIITQGALRRLHKISRVSLGPGSSRTNPKDAILHSADGRFQHEDMKRAFWKRKYDIHG